MHMIPPFHIEHSARSDGAGNQHVYVCDARGTKLAPIWGSPARRIEIATVICNALNEAYQAANESEAATA